MIGMVAGAFVLLQRWLGHQEWAGVFASPFWLLAMGPIGALCLEGLAWRKKKRGPGQEPYEGVADLLVHVHAPTSADGPLAWFLRGTVSFFLSFFGGHAGPEGAAGEWTHAMALRFRSRSSRWFEQRRRTDAASSLAACVASAFGAPFAGVLLPMELGLGGRAISITLSAVIALFLVKGLGPILQIPPLDLSGALYGFHFASPSQWLLTVVLGAGVGIVGGLVVRLIRFNQREFAHFLGQRLWLRMALGGVLLALLAMAYRLGHQPPEEVFESVLWSRRLPLEVLVLGLTSILSLTWAVASFGTMGVFWPVFSLGACLAYAAQLAWTREVTGFSAAAGLLGGAAAWGALLGAPLSGAVLAFEMSGSLGVLSTSVVSALVAREVCRRVMRTPSLVDASLQARGLELVEGRSAAVLEGVLVRDAMVSDHETVHENEAVSSLHQRLLRSKYPFLPVVTAQGSFRGLLTSDMIQDAWREAGHSPESGASNSPLSHLLEAKDILYRARMKVATVREGDRLSKLGNAFEDVPCVPVVDNETRVVGLLFVYNVRLAYEREVVRRSLAFGAPEGLTPPRA